MSECKKSTFNSWVSNVGHGKWAVALSLRKCLIFDSYLQLFVTSSSLSKSTLRCVCVCVFPAACCKQSVSGCGGSVCGSQWTSPGLTWRTVKVASMLKPPTFSLPCPAPSACFWSDTCSRGETWTRALEPEIPQLHCFINTGNYTHLCLKHWHELTAATVL